MDSLGLQFGHLYQYKHYTADSLYETGSLIFNADTSFTEIIRSDTFLVADTFRYHATILYPRNPKLPYVQIPTDTFHYQAVGLKYSYFPRINVPNYLFKGNTILAYCCLDIDSISGNRGHYAPFAYYLKNFEPVYTGTYNGSVIISPPGTDTAGIVQYSDDWIVLEK